MGYKPAQIVHHNQTLMQLRSVGVGISITAMILSATACTPSGVSLSPRKLMSGLLLYSVLNHTCVLSAVLSLGGREVVPLILPIL